MKKHLIKVLALIIPMIAVYAGVEALAYYESYNAIGGNVGGAKRNNKYHISFCRQTRYRKRQG
jgi:hypothetical protein